MLAPIEEDASCLQWGVFVRGFFKMPSSMAGLSAANYCSGERWYVMLNHSLSWGRSLHSPGGGGGGEGGRREGGGREDGRGERNEKLMRSSTLHAGRGEVGESSVSTSLHTHACSSQPAVFYQGHFGTELAGAAGAAQPSRSSSDHQVVETASGSLGHAEIGQRVSAECTS